LRELERDGDDSRRDIALSRVAKLPKLDSPPTVPKDFLASFWSASPGRNDRVDAALLFAVKADAVDMLVTEDRRLHAKADAAGLESRVYYLARAADSLQRLFNVERLTAPNVDDVPLHRLNLEDPIFDSLRADYPGFDEWFRRSARAGRHAWVVRASGAIEGICIYAPRVSEHDRRLKLSTFKVGESSRGHRVGELLVKSVFQACLKNGYSSAYLTAFPKQDFLLDFLGGFGFRHVGSKGAELIYEKSFERPAVADDADKTPLDFHIDHYPWFIGNVRQFVVPIQPRWHDRLFPDGPGQVPLQLEDPAAGNAIRKGYICRAGTTRIRKGDLLLFYRSDDLQAVTTVGVVEATERSSDPGRIAAMLAKRTVYSFADIETSCAKGPTLALLFRQVRHLSPPLSLEQIMSSGALKAPPQTIVESRNLIDLPGALL
jgi:GNAT superfamily N-acetyltransferase